MSDDGWGGFTPEPQNGASQPVPDPTVPIASADPTVPLAAPVSPPPTPPAPPTPPTPSVTGSGPSRRRTGLALGVVVALVVGIGAAIAVGQGGSSSTDTTVAVPSTVAVTVADSIPDTVVDSVANSVVDSAPSDSVPNDSPFAADVRSALTPYQATEYEIGCVTGVADRAGTDAATDPAVAAQVVGCLTTRTLGQLLAEELQKTAGGTIDGICVGEDLDDMTPEQRSTLLAATSSGVDDGTAQQMLVSLVDDCKNP